MGNHGSTQYLEAHYAHLLGKHMRFDGAAVVTGETGEKKVGGAVVGGYSALEDYGNSVYSKAKEELIRGIAEDVASALHINGSFAKSAPIGDVVAKLKRVVPDPKNKKTIKADSGVHKAICDKLASAINKRYGVNIIDENASVGDICTKVGEIMYSLFTGLHTEFLTVSGDISRIVKNLQILQEYVDAANKKLISEISNSGDHTVGTEAQNVKALYNKISEEINRQHAMLTNLTNSVIGPLGKSLVGLLEDNPDFVGLTDDLKKMTGNTYFGEKISYLLSGISDVAHSADLVDKALKKIGMSVAEYKNVKGLKELRDNVYNHIMSKKPSSGELHKLLAAADIIYRNDMAHEDIAEYLAKKKGGYDFNVVEHSYADMVDDATWTDSTQTPFQGRTQSYRKSVGKQVQEQKKYRQMIFADFNRQIKKNYQNIIYNLEKLSKKIGTEIAPSIELEHFIRLLNSFATTQPNKHDLHLALSSYRTDSTSSYIKHQYLEYLNSLLEESQSLIGKGIGGELFKQLASSISALVKIIDDFNANFTKALTETHVDISQPKSKHASVSFGGNSEVLDYDGGKNKHHKKHRENNLAEENVDEVVGEVDAFGLEEQAEEKEHEEKEDVLEEPQEEVVGGMSSISGAAAEVLGGIIAGYEDHEFKHFVTLQRVIRTMDYYYKISNIKSNLRKVASENEANIANYENILGEEAGFMIDQIQKKYNALLADANGQPLPSDCGFTDAKQLFTQGRTAAGIADQIGTANLKAMCEDNGNDLKDQLNGYKFLIEYIRSSKVEMLEAAQALDLYLSKFTRDVEMKPDAIQNFAQIVEQLEIVAKWFNNKSGDNLVSVFEVFDRTPLAAADLNANGVNTSPAAIAFNATAANLNNDMRTPLTIADDTHYYAAILGARDPGLFYKPRLMTRDQAIEFVKRIEKSIKSVRALENIVNIFTKLNVHTHDGIKTFMSPASMFKAFMKYCVASVISVGYKILQGGAAADLLPRDDNQINFNIGGADIVNNHNAFAVAKMAVALKFNEQYVKLNATPAFLHLCDPLEVNEELKGRTGSNCDKIFTMCIKSIVAKIFTVVGSYSLFNKPPKSISMSDAMPTSALRQILGGSDGGAAYVKVNPEAAELYLRLPLLVEWYRSVFEFNKETNANVDNLANFLRQNNPLVSIVPEMDNIWGVICKVIFIDGRNIKDGTYPSEYARKIIESITEIYNTFSQKKKGITCKEILEEFVFEINRRYGFMLRSEINEYLNQKDMDFTSRPYESEDVTDYDLLDVNNQFGRNVAPSDRFRTFATRSNTSRTYTMQQFNNAVKRFRHSIEQNLILTVSGGLDPSDLTMDKDTSIREVIRLTQKRLYNASTDEDKYRIIHEQLHGVEKFGDIDQNKLLAFHETVISPLTILYFTYLIVNNYNKFMVSLNMEKFDQVVNDYLFGTGAAGVAFQGIPIRNCGAAAAHTDPSAAVVAAGNPAGESDIWLANQLLHYNNENFKGTNNLFKLDDNKFNEAREAIFTVNEANEYFMAGWAGGVATALSPANYLRVAALNIDDIDGKTNAASTNEEKKALCTRLLLNRFKLMEDTLRHIMNIACEMNGLVDVSFSGQGKQRYPVVNFDKLEEICNALYQSAKSSVNKLRKSVPYTLIKSVEDVKDDGKTNIVSLFWLQENLFDRLFKNKFGNGLSDGNNGLKNIWRELTREHEFNWYHNNRAVLVVNDDCNTTTAKWGDAAQNIGVIRQPDGGGNNRQAPGVIPVAAGAGAGAFLKEYCYDSYGDVFSKLAFWDVTKDNTLRNALGFRCLTMTDELNQFPAHFIPIYKSGGTFGLPKTKIERETINNNLLINESWGVNANDSKNSFNLDEKVVTSVLRNAGAGGANVETDLFLGAHNLYDYNVNYSNATQLNGSADDVKTRNLGGVDKLAPGLGNYTGLHEKLGLIPKLNNLIYNYVKLFMDPSSKKIYKPLLEKFVNGYNSKDIIQAKNINDRVLCRFDFGNLNDKSNNPNFIPSIDATGVFAARGGAAAPNNLGDMVSAVCELEPPEQSVLFASLANGIRNILTLTTERVSGNVAKYVEDNFANISEYQKEIMRAYLPVFEKQLELIAKRADLLKSLIENTPCKVYKWCQHHATQVAAGAGAGLFSNADGSLFDESNLPAANTHRIFFQTLAENNSNYTQPLRVPKVEYEAQRKTYLINVLTDIMVSAKSLNKCVQGVSKELADIPMFFETYKDSIIDYNNRNGHLPLMPISSITHLMNFNLHRVNKNDELHNYDESNANEDISKYVLSILPQASRGVGSNSFKFAYGTRGVLSYLQKPAVDYVPGVSSLLSYAKLGGARDPGVDELVSNSLILSRFVTDFQYHNQYLDAQRYNVVRDGLDQAQVRNANVAIKQLTCQTGKGSSDSGFWQKTENVVLLAENDNFKQAIYRMVSCMRTNGGKLFNSDRAALRIYNILDMGCVPLNVHALQREIPFINLMNYSYSFDNIVKEIMGNAYKTSSLMSIHGLSPDADNDAKDHYNSNIGEGTYTNEDYIALYHPEDALVRHLIYPNGFRRLREYMNYTYKIVAGDTSLGLNRPKFLSDQLWNKVLMNNLFDTRYQAAADRMRSNESRRQAEVKQVLPLIDINNVFNNVFNDIVNTAAFMTAANNATDADLARINAAIGVAGSDLARAHAIAPIGAAAADHRPFIRALLGIMRDQAMLAVNALVNPSQQEYVYEFLRQLHNINVLYTTLAGAQLNIFGAPGDFFVALAGAGGPGPVAAPLFAGPGNPAILARANLYINNFGSPVNPNQQNSNVFIRNGQITNDTEEPMSLGLLVLDRGATANPALMNSLSWLSGNEVKNVAADPNKLQLCALEGYLRYNTKLVRWTEWFVQLQRCVRILMRNQLEWVQDPVVVKHDALSEQVTDYPSDNRGFNLGDFE